ncbi:succinate dehydrogenase, hydrophobic membrane anchor protein [Celeribacter indicus]|uniref:Succinate dehydrogenase, hydrophobic membrane anchor protein n=1 Tax=Celeribacter indicus TaxID=1208324 RepID=A0A0B5DYR8_9RHOB|nr:succinate dehydrogenase [Celeribacter indicus]AJE48578.1 succinate dehydrogenase, hydrophobic membrane anchor protein [Celeribacter indicus]SDX08889.1 succinate dehydrogenase subunit D [Celeribacter indicus]
MNFLTDRKGATGLGSGRSGTDFHWKILVTSVLLVVLVPLAVFTFGAGLGGTREEVLAYFSHPFVVIVMALALVVGISHFLMEAIDAIEDYIGGIPRKLTLIAANAFAYTLMATGLFALLKLALQ